MYKRLQPAQIMRMMLNRGMHLCPANEILLRVRGLYASWDTPRLTKNSIISDHPYNPCAWDEGWFTFRVELLKAGSAP